jgi:hypothetical protein
LILRPDAPPVTHAHLLTAKEIQTAANTAGLWPTNPRILISTELKDYAQWFGSRAKGQARGILAYLAGRIGATIDQQVQTGTLKRAFGLARWLFIFDGLDEVPSDVKDDVARQVCQFIDDALVGCSADAFTICTSRPQGYAGQFSELDASIVELVALDIEQALACAKPVLEIDRSPQESQEYLTTLRESTSSPSVKEIMTTPLQAHIMAVVVRDGGRPPDRKWQLFNNFYQVIKKREANRNLLNVGLAKLLREDKLLKTLHNRLGFELQKRAETSKGSRTSLDRNEFQQLVRTVVGQLQEVDVEGTVQACMEATTDRLVLVSTPDSGEAVRFDIRPLQEFFAAEFVYEDTEAEVFTKPLQTIAGDAHWREVMHFLLSAIVENSRQTELSIAVSVLVSLNEGDDVSGRRVLKRRLALGGMLAARLLQEGVLEQDKRARILFRKCIEPIFAFTDLLNCDALLDVRQTHSKSWLEGILLDALRESSEPENIGALMVLATTLPDGHSQVDETLSILRRSSMAYRKCFFENLDDYEVFRVHRNEQTKEWLVRGAFESLADDHWSDLGLQGVRGAIELVSAEPERLQAVAQQCGISEELA